MHEGPFKKDITISSNAGNTPRLRLYISGYFKTVLEIEQHSSLWLSPGKESDTGVVIRLRTLKECKIEKVEFRYTENELGMQWESVVPIRFTYEYVKENEQPADKPNLCRIRLFYSPGLSEEKWGKFYITTDLKTEKEIFVAGTMVGRK
ncbi:MAG: hypothetical protein JW863_14065 [Chitinispirillaceae bacterium]|nr:hypothetical protein [Chitinispirillaceae bacterium]